MNNQMMPLATNDEIIKGERQDTPQQLVLDDDIEECLDFS